jgi:hypothetical protein
MFMGRFANLKGDFLVKIGLKLTKDEESKIKEQILDYFINNLMAALLGKQDIWGCIRGSIDSELIENRFDSLRAFLKGDGIDQSPGLSEEIF